MKLRDLGEFELIDRIGRIAGTTARGNRSIPGNRGSVELGIGDDAALLRVRRGEHVVVTTDAFVEDVHFQWSTQTPHTIGRRAVVANLSDLAAMGARPLGFVVALSAPPDLNVDVFDALARGMVREAKTHGCPWVGGNLSRSKQTTIAITAVGAVGRGRALTRTGARVGDRICVTGTLGGVALEVALALRGSGTVKRVPTPRIEAGQALARMSGIGAVIDVSDGLRADLAHLLRDCGGAAEIDDDSIPLARGLVRRCIQHEIAPLELATTGGEDYELAFTVRRSGPGVERLTDRLGVRVSEIGRIVSRESQGARAPTRRGRVAGWRHF